MHVLVVEDDHNSSCLLQRYLEHSGFTVEVVRDGGAGVERGLSGEHDFIVLDIVLPEMDGFEVLRSIREKSNIPVLMLTVRDDPSDRIKGLEMGADDYLIKPYNEQELVARIRTILRRSETKNSFQNNETLEVGDLLLDLGSRRVFRDGEEIVLTAAEFTLLETLASEAGNVVTREELVRRVLGRHHDPYDRSIDVHVSRLRKKLSSHSDGSERIKAVRGVGHFYSLVAEEVD